MYVRLFAETVEPKYGLILKKKEIINKINKKMARKYFFVLFAQLLNKKKSFHHP